jgi:5-oxoprolinase (ATP-hydrolysing)
LLLGRIPEDKFGIAVDRAAARARLLELLPCVDGAPTEEELLEGFLAIADERMAEAVREVSVRRGFDPLEHTLLAFGGAGGLHACAVAARLGMNRVLVPKDQGLLSAVGALEHGRGALRRVSCPMSLDEASSELDERIAAEIAALAATLGASVEDGEREVELEIRQAGQDATLDVAWTPGVDPVAAFADAHRRTYGFAPSPRPLEVVAFRVRLALAAEPIPRSPWGP